MANFFNQSLIPVKIEDDEEINYTPVPDGVFESTDNTENMTVLPMGVLDNASRIRQAEDTIRGIGPDVIKEKPDVPQYYLDHERAMTQQNEPKSEVKEAASFDEPETTDPHSFNWKSLLRGVLAPEDKGEGFNKFVSNFGTSPFLSLIAPSTPSIKSFQDQANENRKADLLARPSSADMQMVDFLTKNGYTPREAFESVMSYKAKAKAPLVSIGDKAESAYSVKRAGSIADGVGELESIVASSEEIAPSVDFAIDYLNNHREGIGRLAYTTLEDTKQLLGMSKEDTEKFRAAMKNISGTLRSEKLRKVLGGQGISNAEHEILTEMLPSENKTAAQNLYLLQHWVEVQEMLKRRLGTIHALERQGADVSDIIDAMQQEQRKDKPFIDSLAQGYKDVSGAKRGDGHNNKPRVKVIKRETL